MERARTQVLVFDFVPSHVQGVLRLLRADGSEVKDHDDSGDRRVALRDARARDGVLKSTPSWLCRMFVFM